jgi:predicted nucleic acid-binding protein
MFLVDTDVLSALAKRRRHANLEAWIERQRAFDLFVSVISIGEIERGIALQQNKDRNLTARICRSPPPRSNTGSRL